MVHQCAEYDNDYNDNMTTTECLYVLTRKPVLAQDYYSDQQEMDSLHISLLLLGRRARLCRFQRYQPMQCNCPQRAGCYARPLPRNSMLTYCSSLFFLFFYWPLLQFITGALSAGVGNSCKGRRSKKHNWTFKSIQNR